MDGGPRTPSTVVDWEGPSSRSPVLKPVTLGKKPVIINRTLSLLEYLRIRSWKGNSSPFWVQAFVRRERNFNLYHYSRSFVTETGDPTRLRSTRFFKGGRSSVASKVFLSGRTQSPSHPPRPLLVPPRLVMSDSPTNKVLLKS